jgi:hypothetical protein
VVFFLILKNIPSCLGLRVFSFKKTLGVNGITRATPTPLGDYLWGVYFEIFLKYFELKYLNFFEKFQKIILHYYVIVYIRNLLKVCKFQKLQVHLQVFLLLERTSSMHSKCFWVLFIH